MEGRLLRDRIAVQLVIESTKSKLILPTTALRLYQVQGIGPGRMQDCLEVGDLVYLKPSTMPTQGFCRADDVLCFWHDGSLQALPGDVLVALQDDSAGSSGIVKVVGSRLNVSRGIAQNGEHEGLLVWLDSGKDMTILDTPQGKAVIVHEQDLIAVEGE